MEPGAAIDIGGGCGRGGIQGCKRNLPGCTVEDSGEVR